MTGQVDFGVSRDPHNWLYGSVETTVVGVFDWQFSDHSQFEFWRQSLYERISVQEQMFAVVTTVVWLVDTINKISIWR